MKKFFIDRSSIHRFSSQFWILPCVSFWFDSSRFLETGIETPALGIEIFWFKWGWGFVIQKGY